MEMISIKSPAEIEKMRAAGRLTAQARKLAGSMVRPGVSTLEIDREVRKFIESHGAKPSFLGYGGFPASTCISVNEVVIHGIPDHRKLKEGDIVSVDRQSFFEGIRFAKVGQRVSDIGHAVQKYVEGFGYGVVRDFVGHGVGREMHEAPEVPNFGAAGHGARFQPGMVIAVEPMVCAGDWRVKVLRDKWTTVSADGSLSAHYENTLLITDGEPELLTVDENGEPA